MSATTMADRRVQRLEALRSANGIRMRRAAFKRDLWAGAASVEGALRDPEGFLLSMPVFELVGLAPGMRGTARVRALRVSRLLRRADVWPLREVGQLTVRQRLRLATELGGEGGR